MKHVSHPSNTRTLQPPKAWDHDAVPCDALPITDMVAGGLPCVVSFWQPEPAELEAIAAGRPVILSIMGGTMPPVALAVDVDQDAAPTASSGVLALVQQRLDERDEYFGHHQRPEPSDEERRTLRVLRQAECELRRFTKIRQAIHDYKGAPQNAGDIQRLIERAALPPVAGEAAAGTIDARGQKVPATVTERPDYIRCIAHDHADLKNESWCGLHVGMEFHFQGVDHAAEHGRQNGRLVACPECVAAITTALQNGCEGTS